MVLSDMRRQNKLAASAKVALVLPVFFLLDVLMAPSLLGVSGTNAELLLFSIAGLCKTFIAFGFAKHEGLGLHRSTLVEIPGPSIKPAALSFLLMAFLLISGALSSLLPGGKQLPYSPPVDTAGMIFLSFNTCFAALAEELAFRLYSLGILIKAGFGAALSICISSFLFALGHAGWGISGFGFALLAGLVLGWAYLKSGSMVPGFAAHMGYNILAIAWRGYISLS